MHKRTGLTREEVIMRLRKLQGGRSQRQLAKDIGITPAYLSDIFLGRRAVGPSVLKHLGLTKNVTTYVSYEKK